MDFRKLKSTSLQQDCGRSHMSRDGMAGVVWKETMVALGPATNKNHERSISLEGLEQNRHLIDTARDGASFSVSGSKTVKPSF
jgi:hypothetical protein